MLLIRRSNSRRIQIDQPGTWNKWKNMKDQEAYDAGFISPSMMSEPSEDFAEMVELCFPIVVPSGKS